MGKRGIFGGRITASDRMTTALCLVERRRPLAAPNRPRHFFVCFQRREIVKLFLPVTYNSFDGQTVKRSKKIKTIGNDSFVESGRFMKRLPQVAKLDADKQIFPFQVRRFGRHCRRNCTEIQWNYFNGGPLSALLSARSTGTTSRPLSLFTVLFTRNLFSE